MLAMIVASHRNGHSPRSRCRTHASGAAPSSSPHVGASRCGRIRGLAASPRPPRCAGVTAARSLLCGANTPWIPRQVHPRRRHQRRKPRHQVQRLEHEVRRAVPVRRLEGVPHLARGGQRQALHGHRRAARRSGTGVRALALVWPGISTPACNENPPARAAPFGSPSSPHAGCNSVKVNSFCPARGPTAIR